MGLFSSIKLVSKITKVVNEVKDCLEANNALTEQLKEVLNIFVDGFNKLKTLLPNTGVLIDDIIKIIKKG